MADNPGVTRFSDGQRSEERGAAVWGDDVGERNHRLLEEGQHLVAEATRLGLIVRLLGGVAILHLCDEVQRSAGFRPLGDIDVIVSKKSARAFADMVIGRGYTAEQRFNALHGDRRMIFEGPLSRLDVLVGSFEMCHEISFEGRLELDTPTVTVTDLLLTKLQVVELNEKDAADILILLRNFRVNAGEGGHVSSDRLQRVVRDDWGLWRTLRGTLSHLGGVTTEATVEDRIREIQNALDAAPRSLRFRSRAAVGERLRWYQLPDDVPGS